MPSTPYHIMFLVRLLQGKEGRVRGAVGSPPAGHRLCTLPGTLG